MKFLKICSILILVSYRLVVAEDSAGTGAVIDTIKLSQTRYAATDLSIPSTPALVLLGSAPATVVQPGFSRDLKTDILIKDDKLISDAAVEAQLAWLILFKNMSRSGYQAAGLPLQTLSTLSASVGTSADDSVKSLAWAFKMTVYRSYDPILDDALISAIRPSLLESPEYKKLTTDSLGIDAQLEHEDISASLREELVARLKGIPAKKAALIASEEERIERTKTEYLKKKWNSTSVDLAYGRIYNYTRSDLDSLNLRDDGYAVWLSAGTGLGSSVSLSALAKYQYVGTQDEGQFGINLRYGGLLSRGFIEYIHTAREGTDTKQITYGLDYRVSPKLVVTFGVRQELDDDFRIRELQPRLNLTWKALNELLNR